MKDLQDIIKKGVCKGVNSLYELEFEVDKVNLAATRKDFEGEYTVVVFPFTKAAKKKPEVIGEELGNFLKENLEEIVDFNVVKGFLNLSIDPQIWIDFVKEIHQNDKFGRAESNGKKVMVEFSSPNTNKPLHLGHIRNILLGWACSEIYSAAGYDVVKTQVINDRGIHICKSMVAWLHTGNGETPADHDIKGDHFVGKYYVKYNQIEKEQKAGLKEGEEAPILTEARSLLQKWEANDPETRKLWETMNSWVYSGFDQTYEDLGVTFDTLYYESQTYLLGKTYIDQGLKDGIFYKKEDGSVWIDLEDAKLDHKLVQRSDGTSVYMTQDIGTAQKRYEDLGSEKMVYVVGDEQNYHFKVLFEIMKRLGVPYSEGMYHLSYGMVDLPSGKMKSREGTVVDADDLIAEVIQEAHNGAKERGSIGELEQDQQDEILRKIGLAALKFFIMKVNPKKRMVFNPKESVDMQGHTGPYIQNAYVRVKSVLRKAAEMDWAGDTSYKDLKPEEKELITMIYTFPDLIQHSAKSYDPSMIANFCYDLGKAYHKFYHEHQILKVEENTRNFRLKLSESVGHVLNTGMGLLGIEMPERM